MRDKKKKKNHVWVFVWFIPAKIDCWLLTFPGQENFVYIYVYSETRSEYISGWMCTRAARVSSCGRLFFFFFFFIARGSFLRLILNQVNYEKKSLAEPKSLFYIYASFGVDDPNNKFFIYNKDKILFFCFINRSLNNLL